MSQTKKYLINGEIKAGKVMVIDPAGRPLGEMRIGAALRAAEDEGLDLVLVAPNSNPPTCRIADFGKLAYEASRKEKVGRRNQKKQEIKELRITPGIAENDLKTKGKAAEKFLREGNRVKAVCRFRGREAARPEEGEQALAKLAGFAAAAGVPEKAPVREGRSLSIMLVPLAPDKRKRKEKVSDGQDVHVLPQGD